jgi:hypothetical protein
MASSRSRPELLAEQLDTALPPGKTTITRSTTTPLIASAVEVAETRFPELSSTALLRIQAQVLAAYDQQQKQQARVLRFTPARQIVRLIAAACFVVLVGAVLSAPLVLQSAPGDALYGAKALYEDVELGFAVTDTGRAEAHLRQASRRVDEVQTLAKRGDYDAALAQEAITSLSRALSGERFQDADIQRRATEITALLRTSLREAAAAGLISPQTALDLESQLDALFMQALIPPVIPEHTPDPTSTPTPTPSMTLTSTPTATMTARATVTLAPTANPTIPPPSAPTIRPVMPGTVTGQPAASGAPAMQSPGSVPPSPSPHMNSTMPPTPMPPAATSTPARRQPPASPQPSRTFQPPPTPQRTPVPPPTRDSFSTPMPPRQETREVRATQWPATRMPPNPPATPVPPPTQMPPNPPATPVQPPTQPPMPTLECRVDMPGSPCYQPPQNPPFQPPAYPPENPPFQPPQNPPRWP